MSIQGLPSSATVLEATEQTAQILALRRRQAALADLPVRVLPQRRRAWFLSVGRLAGR